MGLVTISGSNSGQLVSVTDNALWVEPQSEFLAAVEDGRAFSWAAVSADIDATDTVLAVENNSADYNLHIERIFVATDASGQFVVHTSSGVTMAGTAVTGINLNRGSGWAAPATAKADETGNGQAGASYTGRLIIGWLLANEGITLPVNGGIVLPYDHNIGIDITAEPTGCNATIVGYFKAVA